jgi:hypothetical protein
MKIPDTLDTDVNVEAPLTLVTETPDTDEVTFNVVVPFTPLVDTAPLTPIAGDLNPNDTVPALIIGADNVTVYVGLLNEIFVIIVPADIVSFGVTFHPGCIDWLNAALVLVKV